MLLVESLPNWTDKLQAIAAAVAILFTFITLLKLVIRDKKRESEVSSLSMIAAKLSKMQEEQLNRYRDSKKPHIKVSLNVLDAKSIALTFSNSNKISSIIDYSVSYNKVNCNMTKYAINEQNRVSEFSIQFRSADIIKDLTFNVEYVTEEKYVFVQEFMIWLKGNGDYRIFPAAILDKRHEIVE